MTRYHWDAFLLETTVVGHNSWVPGWYHFMGRDGACVGEMIDYLSPWRWVGHGANALFTRRGTITRRRAKIGTKVKLNKLLHFQVRPEDNSNI